MTPFAAVLLAGGRSQRMGRDKAMLTLPDGRRLWERQLSTLRAMDPAALFVSGPRRDGFPDDLVCLEDEMLGQGPLGGILTALQMAEAFPLLLVLAIDLPAMTTRYLRGLLMMAGPGRGAVPRWTDNRFYEPLVAVYSQECRPVAAARLAAGERGMQGFVRASAPHLCEVAILPSELALFANWNAPNDIPNH